jgi:hypothetical protein
VFANLKKLRHLSRPEVWLLGQAALALPLVGLGLRCLGFRRLQASLARWSASCQAPEKEIGETNLARAYAAARMVQLAARHGLYRPACLPQSLALWWLLRRQGISSDLHLGVKPSGDHLEAHAWVALQERILSDGEDAPERFHPFPPFIPKMDLSL